MGLADNLMAVWFVPKAAGHWRPRLVEHSAILVHAPLLLAKSASYPSQSTRAPSDT